eukprot:gene40244-26064_t
MVGTDTADVFLPNMSNCTMYKCSEMGNTSRPSAPCGADRTFRLRTGVATAAIAGS